MLERGFYSTYCHAATEVFFAFLRDPSPLIHLPFLLYILQIWPTLTMFSSQRLNSKESTSVGWCTLHSEGHANSCCIQPWESEFNTPSILLFCDLPSISLSSFRTSSRVDQLCIYFSLKKTHYNQIMLHLGLKLSFGILSIFYKIQILKQIYQLWGIPFSTPRTLYDSTTWSLFFIVWEWANFFLL